MQWRVAMTVAGLVCGWTGAVRAAEVAPAPAGGPGGSGVVREVTVEEWLGRARNAQQRGLLKQALEFAGRAVEVGPREPRAWHYRAQLHERLKDLRSAEADMTRLVELAPGEPAVWMDRGILRLRQGDYVGSVSDLDRFAELRPAKASHLWQRGIALFYAGRFEDGRRQFELHRTSNPEDVENSAWHYACLARTDGAVAARARWMPVDGDMRVPMAEIQELYLGKRSPEQLLGAVEAVRPESRRGSARFYAHLYLALFHGAQKEREREAHHAAEAARLAGDHGIMGEIAKLHVDWVAAELRRKP
jgi:lipoprotein NlpI